MGINMKFNKWFDDDEGFLDAVAGDPQNEAERVWNASRKAVLKEVEGILDENTIVGAYEFMKTIKKEINQLAKEER